MTRLYVAMESELLVVSGTPGRWQADTQLAGLPVQSVAVDPLRPEHVYCGTFGQGLWRSEDAGATWRQAGRTLAQAQVTAVAVSRLERVADCGVVWVGTEPSALFRSEDRGETWTERPSLLELASRPTWSFPPRPDTHHVRWIAPDATAARRLFVSIERGGVMRSLDAGETWEDRKPTGPLDAHTLCTHARAPGLVYAAAGDGFLSPGSGFALSRDGGETWQRFGAGLRHHYLWGLAVDAGDPGTVVVSAASGPRAAHDFAAAESAIYRRAGEEAWREVGAGLPPAEGTLAAVLAASDAEPGVFYAASNRGLYRSADAGVSWERIAVPWPDSYRRRHPQALVAAG